MILPILCFWAIWLFNIILTNEIVLLLIKKKKVSKIVDIFEQIEREQKLQPIINKRCKFEPMVVCDTQNCLYCELKQH